MFHLKKILIVKNMARKMNVLRLCSLQNNNLIEWNNVKSNYSSKELKKIFNTLNKISETEMKKLGLSDEKIKLLESNKNKKKKYKSLDDFVALNVMQATELDVICSNLLTRNATKPKNIVSPSIANDKRESIKVAVGLRIRDSYMSWSQLKLSGSTCSLLNWDCHKLSDLPANANISEIIQKAKTITKTIPDADAYVMEKDSSKPPSKINTSILRSSVRHQQFLSIILTLLSTRYDLKETADSDFFSSLYTLRPYASAQLFGLFYGNEIVSAMDIVNNLLFHGSNTSLKNITSVEPNYEITDQYNSMDQYMKEELNKSFLLALTFFESGVLEHR